jgi:stalled ribosome rescue protein Dom34
MIDTWITQERDNRDAIAVRLHRAIVWIDEKEARIMHVDEGIHHDSTFHALDIHDAPTPPEGNRGTIAESNPYFHQVARALDPADEILIVGPCSTKLEFVKYMHKNDHAIDPRILGVETIAHLNDNALAGFAKLYFTVGGALRAANGSRLST